MVIISMKFELEEYHRTVTDEELLAELQRVASKLNKTAISRAANDEHGKYHSATYVRRFGSWFTALEKAGLETTATPINISDEDLFHNLEEMWIKLGRQPRFTEVERPISKYHAATYRRRFGNWRKALEKFVVYINSEEAISSEEAIELIKPEVASRHKTGRNINWRLRFVVMRRDNFKCKVCGLSPAADPSIILHVDHIKAWANGGETVFENLQTLCSKCNIGKSDLE
jgi:hypothetical protein